MVAQTVQELIKQACSIIQNATTEESVDLLAWLLFLKYSEQREAELQKTEAYNSSDEEPEIIPENCRWSSLMGFIAQPDTTNQQIEDRLQGQILRYFKERFQLDLAYKHPLFVYFKDVCDFLQQFDSRSTGKSDYDIVSSLYDSLLQLLTSQSQYRKSGVFATPYPVAHFMVQVLNPQKSEYMYDPSGGVGNLLLTAYEYRDTPSAQIIRGSDNNARILQLARMNLLLHGINTKYICEKNPLATQSFNGLFEDSFDDDIKKLDIIINHPPLGDYVRLPVQKHAHEQLKRIDEWFLRYNMGMLQRFPGSRCGMVIAERTLKGIEDKTEKKEGAAHLRLRLFRDYTIQMIVHLPRNIFPFSNEKTFLLFFTGEPTQRQRTLHYDLTKQLGIVKYSQKRPLRVTDFQKVLETWKQWDEHLKNPASAKVPTKTDYQWIETYEGWKDDDQEQHYPYSLLTNQKPESAPEAIDPCILVERLVQNSNELHQIAQRLQKKIYGGMENTT